MIHKAQEQMSNRDRQVRSMVICMLCAIGLTGCLATNQDLTQETLAPQTAVQPAAQTATTQPATVGKEQKLLEEKNRLNKYVNQQTPSQLRYSLQVLNEAAPDDGIYPTIEDLSKEEENLRTAEERRKIEAELEALSK